MAVMAILRLEAVPGWEDSLWAAAAGVCGAIGIAILYHGLAHHPASLIAPTSAVIGASLPAIFSFLTEGLPSLSQFAGFALGILGIGLVSRSPEATQAISWRGFGHGLGAGLSFGVFFIFLSRVEGSATDPAIFAPLVVSKLASASTAILFLRLRRERTPILQFNPFTYLAGLLDAGGNIFFFLAQQLTRLDIATVLSSMYAAVTVLLARLILRQRISLLQGAGVLLCMLAIGLIL